MAALARRTQRVRPAQDAVQSVEALGRGRCVHANDGRSGCNWRRAADGHDRRTLQAKGIQPCIPGAGRATSRSGTTSAATGVVAASRSCAAASRIGAGSPPATTAALPPSSPPSPSPPLSFSGYDQRVLTLTPGGSASERALSRPAASRSFPGESRQGQARQDGDAPGNRQDPSPPRVGGCIPAQPLQRKS